VVLRSLLDDGWMVRYCLPFARLPGKPRSTFLLPFRLDLSLFDDQAGENTHTRGADQSVVSICAAVPIVEHVTASPVIASGWCPYCTRLWASVKGFLNAIAHVRATHFLEPFGRQDLFRQNVPTSSRAFCPEMRRPYSNDRNRSRVSMHARALW